MIGGARDILGAQKLFDLSREIIKKLKFLSLLTAL
jgi:hypothetical protein